MMLVGFLKFLFVGFYIAYDERPFHNYENEKQRSIRFARESKSQKDETLRIWIINK